MYKDGGIKCINDGIFSVAVFLWGGWRYGRKSVVKIRVRGKLLLFPFCVLSHSVVSDSLQPHGVYSLLGSSVHRDSPGKNTGVGCHSNSIFLTF